MAKYIKFSEMEIDQANRIDIKSLLEKNGERLKRSGIAWEWKHQGKKISICENKWFDQYERIGGHAIKFVMIFYNKSFQEAVLQLLKNAEELLRLRYKNRRKRFLYCPKQIQT